ncbi:toprim domain-containing protein [Niameybacter massiliensis]|uniref:DNA topoisomerase (ATP-hydrolyzing) n=1 Tax=Holtiella tumoricola TaxID=3018743 RepID=A0AA42DNP6_9FIRM|nr:MULTISPECIES: toprim domain-containing protein [Lachnospirales]MDA3732419.1 toprim domain-containing protein [Holtiella tumoricola]
MKKDNYGNQSISSLKGADRVRLRPSVIFGSDGIEGCQHSVFEILSNAIDEAKEGYGNVIDVTLCKDHSIIIQDYGRGMPLDYNEKEGRYNWDLIFCELYAGGKYNNNEGQNYEFSLGLNGLGACATQYSSEFMDVEVHVDGYAYELHFEKGENIGGLRKQKANYKTTGTRIHWKPDKDVFADIHISSEYFHNVLKRQAIVNQGITFNFDDQIREEKSTYVYPDGILGYVKEVADGKQFTEMVLVKQETRGQDSPDRPEYRVKFEIAFTFCNEATLLEYYHNSSYLEYGGAPDKAIKNAFVYSIDQYLKNENLYNKDEKKITFVDIQDSLILITNSFSTITSYENQTKKAITNKFIQEAMQDFLKDYLAIYFIENKDEATRIAKQVLVNKRSREKAERTRINVRKQLGGTIDITNRIKKFVDCRTKDVTKRELYIVEGDSALGSCKLGRNAEFQGIMAVRGKILNCLKSDYDKIFKSDIIIDLLKVLGCGVEITSKHNKELHTFELDNLRWQKVVICTDADVDGFQIRTLILAMLYALVPTLIKEGKVFIAETPLYEINTKDKTYFAYSDYEKVQILDKIKSKYTIQRSKGLGENDPEMMWETTMNPESRRLIQVMPEDAERTQEVFERLLGDNLAARKAFIAEVGHEYLDQLDMS